MSASPILLLDGGLGTTLETHYQQIFTEETPLWSSHLLISDPSTLVAGQRSFVEAGVDLLSTATYQASFEGFGRTTKIGDGSDSGKEKKDGQSQVGYGKEEAKTYMRFAISLAELAITSSSPESKPRGPKIVLSLGPYGAVPVPSQEYTGKYPSTHDTADQLSRWHLERLRVFADHAETWDRIEYVAFETVPRVDEILAVREAMAALPSPPAHARKFCISCVFPHATGDARQVGWNHLPDGSTITQAVAAMLDPLPHLQPLPLPWGIGINCTKTTHLSSLILEFEEAVASILERCSRADQPPHETPYLVVYPDNAAGLCYNTTSRLWEAAPTMTGDSDRMVSWDEAVFELVRGVRERGQWRGIAVGGCCKTAPSDIRRLRHRIDGAGWASPDE